MKSEKKISLIIVQLYNFIIGLLAPIIHVFIILGVLIIFNDSGWDLIIDNLFYKAYAICMVLIFTLLLIPINKYMKKKINMNLIFYLLLSIIMIGLGILSFVFIDKLSI